MKANVRLHAAVLSGFTIMILAISIAQEPPSPATSAAPNSPAKPAWNKNVEILSDTKGYDFKPYISKLVKTVQKNWYGLVPEEARPPQLMSGETTIEFAILRDGKVAGMRIVHGSGSVPLDRAAWGGLTSSNPFEPLPLEFTGPYLALRIHFLYNPNKTSGNNQPESNDFPDSPH